MKFCSNCGQRVSVRIPPGDALPRHVCSHCDTIHYQNPKIVAGTLPVWKDKVLLCRRAIEPRYGLWTLPAGFMENDETTEEAASREALEEANARLEIVSLYTLISLPHVNQVYIMYRAKLLDDSFSPGAESLEVRLFDEKEIPWNELAFKTIEHTLQHFFRDRSRGAFGVYSSAISLK